MQEERAEQALLAYRQTILMALAEVASATLAYNQEQVRLEALQGAVEGLHYRNAPAEKTLKRNFKHLDTTGDSR